MSIFGGILKGVMGMVGGGGGLAGIMQGVQGIVGAAKGGGGGGGGDIFGTIMNLLQGIMGQDKFQGTPQGQPSQMQPGG